MSWNPRRRVFPDAVIPFRGFHLSRSAPITISMSLSLDLYCLILEHVASKIVFRLVAKLLLLTTELFTEP